MFLQHDSTVLALLSSLNLFNGRIVPYSCTVMVELHQDAISGWYVQIHLKNSSDPNTQQMHTLTIPGTVHHLCHKSNFNKFIVCYFFFFYRCSKHELWQDFLWLRFKIKAWKRNVLENLSIRGSIAVSLDNITIEPISVDLEFFFSLPWQRLYMEFYYNFLCRLCDELSTAGFPQENWILFWRKLETQMFSSSCVRIQ